MKLQIQLNECKNLESLPYDLDLFSPEKRRLRGDFITDYKYLKYKSPRVKWMRPDLFSGAQQLEKGAMVTN